MRRHEFISLVGGAMAVLPLMARAQQSSGKLPAIGFFGAGREAVVSGGLMSYGNDLPETYRLIGTYTARIVKGAMPGELPVLQPTKFEFVLNLKAAKALGLNIPSGTLAIADEVVE